jgi:hypothetical protein
VVTAYYYDHRNRLYLLANHPQYAGTHNFQVYYYYDAQNQLVRRLVDPDGGTGGAAYEQTIFMWDDGQIVLEFDQTGSDWQDEADLSHRYVWGPGVDQLLVDEVVESLTDAGDNDRMWALTDHLGTIRDWVDDDGNLLDHAQYDSAGRRLDKAAIDAAFGFQGLLHVDWIELNYNRAPWSDPNTGTFLSEDPIKDGYNWRVAYGNADHKRCQEAFSVRNRIGISRSARSRCRNWRACSVGWPCIRLLRNSSRTQGLPNAPNSNAKVDIEDDTWQPLDYLNDDASNDSFKSLGWRPRMSACAAARPDARRI